MKKTNLLIIDAQNDFCDPKGSLYVQGANEDSHRLADFIRLHSKKLNNIYVTLDSHHNYDIAHPIYWKDADGNHPDPFTIITKNDLAEGKWVSTREKDRKHAVHYVNTLAENGRYQLCIWPPHCLIGSWGTQIQDDIFNSITQWELENVTLANKIYKGNNPGTEHYGAFEAEVPQADDTTTHMNTGIIEDIKDCDTILVAGQALDYCVANTVRQFVPGCTKEEIGKIVLLDDCCSSVNPASGLSSTFLNEMIKTGMTISNSRDIQI